MILRALCCVLLVGLASAQDPIEPGGERPARPPEAANPPAKPAAPSANALPGGLGAMELAQAMTATMQLSTPGEPHRALMSLAGRFDVAMTLRPIGLPEQECKGNALAAAVLGGRYLIVNCNVRVQAVRVEGLYLFGFDNLHGLYTASWRDSLSTWSVECSGPPDVEHPDRIEMKGTMVDAASPTGRPFVLSLQMHDDGFEIVARDTAGDALVEVLRQRFVRSKAPAEGESGAGTAAPTQTGK